MNNILDLRPMHIRTPYTPLRRFFAIVGFFTIISVSAAVVVQYSMIA